MMLPKMPLRRIFYMVLCGALEEQLPCLQILGLSFGALLYSVASSLLKAWLIIQGNIPVRLRKDYRLNYRYITWQSPACFGKMLCAYMQAQSILLPG